MVFFASPEPSVGKVAEKIKSKLFSFIWVPWEDVDDYIKKSDAILIGPGFMRFGKETQNSKLKTQNKLDEAGKLSYDITKRFLTKFPKKRWVIDAGSLQVMETDWIPRNSVLTPNVRELELLFKVKGQEGGRVKELAKKYDCVINAKGPVNIVCSPKECFEIPGGNPGLEKGGVGDVLAGLTVALLAKNDPFLAACSASYITKTAADELYKKVGTNYNADDLANKIPEVLHKLSK